MVTEQSEHDTTTGGAQGDRLQEAASGLAGQAARTAEATASTTMTRAGDTLEQVARAIRDAGNGMRDQQPQLADVATTAAQRVEEASRYLRDHQAGEVIDNAQRWAREQPALVIGGGLAVGLLIGRFLKSGSSQGGGDNGRYSQGARYGASGSYAGYAGGEYAGTPHGSSQYGGGYPSSSTGPTGAGAAGLGGSAAGLAGTSRGYETSSAGYAGSTDYGTGALSGDAVGTGTSTGSGSLGGVGIGSTLDDTPGGYASGADAGSAGSTLEPDVSSELQATDEAASTKPRSSRRRRS